MSDKEKIIKDIESGKGLPQIGIPKGGSSSTEGTTTESRERTNPAPLQRT